MEKINRYISVTNDLIMLERMRTDKHHNKIATINYTWLQEREKWQKVVVEKDAVIAEQATLIARLRAELEVSRGKN